MSNDISIIPQATGEYEFDHALFCTFLADLGIKRVTVLKATNVPPTTWDRWRQSGSIPLSYMVTLCNTLCIPISRFIKSTTFPPGKVTVDMQWEADVFTPIEYKPQLMGDYMTYGRGKSVDDACTDLGIHPSYFYQHFRNEVVSKIPISDFLKRCNTCKMWPGNWIIDNNEPITLIEGYHVAEFTEEDAAKIRAHIEENAVLKQSLQIQERKIAELEAEIQRLRDLQKKETYISRAAEEIK